MLNFNSGATFALLSAAFAAVAIIITKYIPLNINSFEISFYRYLIGVCFIAPFIFPLTGNCKNYINAILMGLVLFTFFPFLFNESVRNTSSSISGVILSFTPVFTLILQSFFSKTTPPLPIVVSVVISIIGVLMVTETYSKNLDFSYYGVSMMLLASLCGAVYTLFSREHVLALGGIRYTAVAMISGTFFSFVFIKLNGLSIFDNDFFDYIYHYLYLGIFGGFLQFVFYTESLKRIKPYISASFLCMVPVFSIFLGWYFHGEVINAFNIVGVVIVFFSMVYISSNGEVYSKFLNTIKSIHGNETFK